MNTQIQQKLEAFVAFLNQHTVNRTFFGMEFQFKLESLRQENSYDLILHIPDHAPKDGINPKLRDNFLLVRIWVKRQGFVTERMFWDFDAIGIFNLDVDTGELVIAGNELYPLHMLNSVIDHLYDGGFFNAWDDEDEKENKDEELVTGTAVAELPLLEQVRFEQSRAFSEGFNYVSANELLDQIKSEIDEIEEALSRHDKIHTGKEIGDLLFAVLELCTSRGFNPEECLEGSLIRFKERFQLMKTFLKPGKTLRQLTREEQLKLWEKAKAKINQRHITSMS